MRNSLSDLPEENVIDHRLSFHNKFLICIIKVSAQSDVSPIGITKIEAICNFRGKKIRFSDDQN